MPKRNAEMAEQEIGIPKDANLIMIWQRRHGSPLPIGHKYLVYFLCCLRPHKLWVAWPVEEMRRDRKEIEMGPPGLSGTLKESPPHGFKIGTPGFWRTLQVWPPGTQLAVRYWAWSGSSVSGPSHTWVPAILGNNALSSKPFQFTFSLPKYPPAHPNHQLENYNLICWGAFCICAIFIKLFSPMQCVHILGCYFNQVHECPAICKDCQLGGNDPKSPAKLCSTQLLGHISSMCI